MLGNAWGPVSTYVDTLGAAVLAELGDRPHLVARTLATILQGGLTLMLSAGHAGVEDGYPCATFNLMLKEVPLPFGESAGGLPFLADRAPEPVEMVSRAKRDG